MKKQRTFYMNDTYWNKLMGKVKENGFIGKGRLERFMEKVCDDRLIFVQGKGKIIIDVE